MEPSNNFVKALTFTLSHEGGYVNIPSDPGGETKWGISKRAHPTVDIRNLTEADAAQIYYDEYWVPSGCDGLDLPLQVAVFDTAVNCGVGRAKAWLKNFPDPHIFLQARRTHYYALVDNNEDMRKFLNGWLNRLNDLTKLVDILISDLGS